MESFEQGAAGSVPEEAANHILPNEHFESDRAKALEECFDWEYDNISNFQMIAVMQDKTKEQWVAEQVEAALRRDEEGRSKENDRRIKDFHKERARREKRASKSAD